MHLSAFLAVLQMHVVSHLCLWMSLYTQSPLSSVCLYTNKPHVNHTSTWWAASLPPHSVVFGYAPPLTVSVFSVLQADAGSSKREAAATSGFTRRWAHNCSVCQRLPGFSHMDGHRGASSTTRHTRTCQRLVATAFTLHCDLTLLLIDPPACA
jgi:hypothetical protein